MSITMSSSAHPSPRPSIKVDLAETGSHCGIFCWEEVKFGAPLSESLKEDHLPSPLVNMLVYIAQEGVTTTDLFRRPGNSTDSKLIIKKLMDGKEVTLGNYNFYTLASVIKKFLLKIPGGIFGPDVERRLLNTLEKAHRMEQYDAIHSIISSLPRATQQLLSLLFGTWFRIVNYSEFNAMSSEAVAKSVAGSLFHTCADDPKKIQKAVEVLQILIDDFAVANMFGKKNIQYFADMTQRGIKVREKFRYEYRYPAGESTQSAQSHLELFALSLQKEAARRGFHLQHDAISEEEFYGGISSQSQRDTHQSQGSSIEIHGHSPPSPQSLHPHDGQDCNPHKKLTHVSSLSAPEVNKGYSPTQELSPAKCMYLSTSLNKFDNVKKRQMMAMKKRSNWFLDQQRQQQLLQQQQQHLHHPHQDALRGGVGATSSSLADTDSPMGSREASVCKSSKSSLDGMSSEALSAAGDITVSDGAISDTPRVPSDFESTFDEADLRVLPPPLAADHVANLSTSTTTTGAEGAVGANTPQSDPMMVKRIHHQDIVNGNHKNSTPTSSTTGRSRDSGISGGGKARSEHMLAAPPSPWDSSRSPSPGDTSPGSGREVRYFQVDSYYDSQSHS